jgi:hypothetical protein
VHTLRFAHTALPLPDNNVPQIPMMLFGSKATFAIEAMIEPHLRPPGALWGRMCIWCDGVSIGDINEEHCGLVAFYNLASLAATIDDLWLQEFNELNDLDLWNYLDGILYGYHGDIQIDDNRTLAQVTADSSKYSRFNFLTNWGEMFDQDGKSFIFHHPEGKIKILNRHLPASKSISVSTSKEAFVLAISDAFSWFHHEQIMLAASWLA